MTNWYEPRRNRKNFHPSDHVAPWQCEFSSNTVSTMLTMTRHHQNMTRQSSLIMREHRYIRYTIYMVLCTILAILGVMITIIGYVSILFTS